jgi:enoyl-CoA hydratase/carnithine racemase
METLTFDVDDGVGTLRLNRPDRHNAISLQMTDELMAIRDQVAGIDVRALVITGAGGTFCSGLDLAEIDSIFTHLAATPDGGADPIAAGITRLQGIARWLDDAPFPTIAAVTGAAIGGGFELATSCDLRIVTPDARLGLSEIRLGLVPDLGGSQRLPRLVGLGRAKDLLFTGDTIDGVEAHRIGWANRLVEPDELDHVSAALARRLAGYSRVALREAKALANGAFDVPIDEGLAREAAAMSRCAQSPEFRTTSLQRPQARR